MLIEERVEFQTDDEVEVGDLITLQRRRWWWPTPKIQYRVYEVQGRTIKASRVYFTPGGP